MLALVVEGLGLEPCPDDEHGIANDVADGSGRDGGPEMHQRRSRVSVPSALEIIVERKVDTPESRNSEQRRPEAPKAALDAILGDHFAENLPIDDRSRTAILMETTPDLQTCPQQVQRCTEDAGEGSAADTGHESAPHVAGVSLRHGSSDCGGC